MGIKLQHGDSLYQVIEKVNEIIDGTVKPGSGGGGSSGGGSSGGVTVNMLEAETDRATGAEQYLQDQIDIINTLIGAGDGDEDSTNSGEDNELQSALIMESIHAATREQANTENIATEVARATAAEQALGTRITDETTRATAAEQDLQDQIDAIDISGLQQDIDDEVTRATAAEQNLQNQINNIVASIDGTKQTWSYAGQIPLGVHVACYRRYGNVSIQIGGSVTPRSAGGAGTYNVTTIPEQYRPPHDIYIPFTGVLNLPQGYETKYVVIISTTGAVTINIYSTAAEAAVGWLYNTSVSFPAWN